MGQNKKIISVALGLILLIVVAVFASNKINNQPSKSTGRMPPSAESAEKPDTDEDNVSASPDQQNVSSSREYSRKAAASINPSLPSMSSTPENLLPIGRYRDVVFPNVGSFKDITYKTRPAMKLVENSPTDYDVVNDALNNVDLKLNMYYPQNDPLGERPLLIFVYGGGWWVGDRYQREADAEYFASLGYVTMTIDYTMFPGDTVLNPLPTVDNSPYTKIVYESASDVYSAYQYALANKAVYGIDTSRIGIGGWSAGGMLSHALIHLQALPKPYGVKAVLGLSNILPADLSNVFELTGGLKTYDSSFNPVSMFASYDDDTGFAGNPNDHAADCAYLDSNGHTCITVTYPGSGHVLDFSIEPALINSVPFFAENVAGY